MSQAGSIVKRIGAVVACSAVFAVATTLTVLAGFYRVFTLFMPYDDEGYLLISLRGFLRGGRLYDDVYTQYGPFYYEFMGAVFGLLGLDVTHDVGRLVSLVVWVATSLVCGVTIALAARSVLVGAAAQLLVFRVFWDTLGFEPMHPGGLLCLLLACLAATPLLASRRPVLASILQGALIAALLLTKINVGAFAALAVATSAIPALIAARRRALAIAVTIAVALVPFALMRQSLDEPWARAYAAFATLSILGIALMLQLDRGASPKVRSTSIAFLSSLAIAIAAIVVVISSLGTSPSALINGVLIAPMSQPSVFTSPLDIPTFALVVNIAAFVACAVVMWRVFRSHERPSKSVMLVAALMRMGIAVALILAVIGAFEPGWPGGFLLAGVAWLAALRPRGVDATDRFVALRRFVPALATLQVLHAYPVASSQISWSSFLLIPTAFLCGIDGCRQLSACTAWAGALVRSATLRTCAALLLSCAVAASYVPRITDQRREYEQNPPARLAGATMLHVPKKQANTLLALVNKLKRRCDTFVSLPGLNSLYLWTGMEPPTELNATAWVFLFDEPLQARIVERVQTIERLCLVRQPQFVAGWADGKTLPDRSLLRYLEANFVLAERAGIYEVCVRKEAAESSSAR